MSLVSVLRLVLLRLSTVDVHVQGLHARGSGELNARQTRQD